MGLCSVFTPPACMWYLSISRLTPSRFLDLSLFCSVLFCSVHGNVDLGIYVWGWGGRGRGVGYGNFDSSNEMLL